MIEVEIKLPLKDKEVARRKLKELGAHPIGAEKQMDIYYNAPHRNLAETDEALRIRFSKDASLTYKGPKLDKMSKTREEIVVSIADADQTSAILKALGFDEVARITKHRETYRLNDFMIMIDNVFGLGTFMEIEASVPKEGDYRSAQDRIFGLLDRLGLKKEDTIRESYLELILDR
ncbi:MAG: class IV adenylate cyclase [Methanocellales archaeon]|nr:class IV adenylate cyclase [Methanocellales archaeon]MDD3291354.1 class IV adenylate cyclase [Methanocellales archaeon]MDD5234756.1 class IV adenylate cyclase [Methanocellales archaeon]MDD5484893.1 class IV adenylate cyclase [Methanocellales archaeon]